MKILKISANSRKRVFEVETQEKIYTFPFARLHHGIHAGNRVADVFPDEELGCEAFTYLLESGETDTIHIDNVLDYNGDPRYLNDLFLYKLTIEALNAIEESELSKRELIRRLGTSASQFYRLLDTTNYSKSAGQMIALLHLLDREVTVTVKETSSKRSQRSSRAKSRPKTSAGA